MNYGKLLSIFIAAVSALGHNSYLEVRNLRFDLVARKNNRRIVLKALKKLNRLPPYRRKSAMKNQRQNRRNRFARYHS